jgi:hypothetical protein
VKRRRCSRARRVCSISDGWSSAMLASPSSWPGSVGSGMKRSRAYAGKPGAEIDELLARDLGFDDPTSCRHVAAVSECHLRQAKAGVCGPQRAKRTRTRTAVSAAKPRLDLTEPDSAVVAAWRRLLPVMYLVAPYPRLRGASIGRRGAAISGGPQVAGAGVVDLRAGDHPRLQQAGSWLSR